MDEAREVAKVLVSAHINEIYIRTETDETAYYYLKCTNSFNEPKNFEVKMQDKNGWKLQHTKGLKDLLHYLYLNDSSADLIQEIIFDKGFIGYYNIE